VPIHASTQKSSKITFNVETALSSVASPFPVSQRGNRLDSGQVRRTFYALSERSGSGDLPQATDASARLPHRLAVQTLVQWYRSGQDVERRLPYYRRILVMFMSAIPTGIDCLPELMGLAVKRLEKRWEGQA